MFLTRGSESVPVRVPISGYEQCMEEGRYVETVASKLDDVKCDKVEHIKAHLEGEYSQKK